MNWLLDALGTAGHVLDTPGAYLRGALAGRPGERSSGEDLLGSYGVEGGPWGGLAAEMVLDPLAIAGPALGALKGVQGINRGTRALAGLADADDANPMLRALAGLGDESGAMRPFQEIGRRTDPDWVNSVDWYHGTATPGMTPQSLDPMKSNPNDLFGRGAPYMSAAPPVTEGYAGTRAAERSKLLMDDPAYLDALGDHNVRLSALIDQWERERPGVGLNEWLDSRIQPLPRPKADPLIYEANTNFGNILDLDQPVDDRFTFGMGDYVAGLTRHADPDVDPVQDYFSQLLDQLGSGDVTAGDMVGWLKPSRFKSLPPDLPDPMIKALREMGYDAMTHTGGGRWGQGDLYHDVMIALDPNDMVSKVGRTGQITRFDPYEASELLRRLGGP